MPAVYEHYAPADADYPDGVYRVVGTDEDRVTLLRVADADGRRHNTGELLTVRHATFEEFEPAPNPDDNRPPRAVLVGLLRTGYWSIRAFAGQLLAHPGPAAVALALVLLGAAGDGFLPDPAGGVLILVGSLALAYVGGGRL